MLVCVIVIYAVTFIMGFLIFPVIGQFITTGQGMNLGWFAALTAWVALSIGIAVGGIVYVWLRSIGVKRLVSHPYHKLPSTP